MFKYLKKILCYFRTVEIYEKNSNLSFKFQKKLKFKIYRRLSSIKRKEILNYFKIYQDKKKRFQNNCVFLTLSFKNNFVSSGWLFRGKKWKITEVNRDLNVLNKFVIFDFITLPEHRNKGYYTKLLKLIINKFKKKNILIYVLRSNKKSKKAILKAGFNFKYKIKAFG